jgi:hypothetical protein
MHTYALKMDAISIRPLVPSSRKYALKIDAISIRPLVPSSSRKCKNV